MLRKAFGGRGAPRRAEPGPRTLEGGWEAEGLQVGERALRTAWGGGLRFPPGFSPEGGTSPHFSLK